MSKPDIIFEIQVDDEQWLRGYSLTRLYHWDCGEWLEQHEVGWIERKFLAEIARLQAESEWQPFETAPTDETWIEVWCEDGGAKFARCFQGKWWADDGYVLDDLPTHWRPLPKGPG